MCYNTIAEILVAILMCYDCHYFGPVLHLFSPTIHNCSYIQYNYSGVNVLRDVDISVFVRVYSRN